MSHVINRVRGYGQDGGERVIINPGLIQVVQAGKNVTVNAPSTTVNASPRVRHDESSLRVYLNSRMALA